MKCVVIDGLVVKGIQEPKVFSFILGEAPVFNVICQRETVHFKKINKSVLKTITLCLEDHNHKEVNSNQKSLTFTL